jgi:hypothetical protein
MIGLRAYLLKTYKKEFDVGKRMFLLSEDEASEFFLWRVVDGKLVKAPCEYKGAGDSGPRLMSFDTALAGSTGGVLYCIDEAWKFWGSRNWQRTGEGMLFYGAQHRKFGDDVLICTQHTKQIDPAIQRVAQDFWVVRNHGKMTFGMFRQPAVFSVSIYDQAPTGASIEPMSRKLFTLDRAGLAQTYDTSAGVGLSGRMMADMGARTRGLPPWMMIVAVFGILALVYYGLSFGSKMLTHAMTKAATPVTQQITKGLGQKVGGVRSSNVVADATTVVIPVRPLEGGILQTVVPARTNEIFCRGYFLHGSRVMVFLSDGRIADSDDGEVQRVQKRMVEVLGGRFEVKRREPDYFADNYERNFGSGRMNSSMDLSERPDFGVRDRGSGPVVGMIPKRSVLPGPLVNGVSDIRSKLTQQNGQMQSLQTDNSGVGK